MQVGLDFGGARVNFVQVGLGTSRTFIQNLAGESRDWDHSVDWLLKACSEDDIARFCGVAIEPVAEHVASLRIAAEAVLPWVDLVQVAIGMKEASGVDAPVLGIRARDA
jgi:hypothetical protein